MPITTSNRGQVPLDLPQPRPDVVDIPPTPHPTPSPGTPPDIEPGVPPEINETPSPGEHSPVRDPKVLRLNVDLSTVRVA